MGKSKMFTLTGPDSKLSISSSAAKKKRLRQSELRIGQYMFTVYDGGTEPTIDTVVDIPSISQHMLFVYPITFASNDHEVMEFTETKFRKLLENHILNPEMFEDEDVDDYDYEDDLPNEEEDEDMYYEDDDDLSEEEEDDDLSEEEEDEEDDDMDEDDLS